MQTPPSDPQSYPPPGSYAPPVAPQKQSKTLLYIIIGVVVLCLGCVAVTGILFAMGIAKLPAVLEAVSTEMPAVEDIITQVAPAQPTVDLQGPATFPSQYVVDVILAESVTEGDMAPVNPTSVFNSSSVIHAVVDIKDAPVDTVFKSVWYVEDVGDAADPDTLISETELSTSGTRYIDFNLTPNTGWPSGTYRVEIFVNGALHQVLFYTVQ